MKLSVAIINHGVTRTIGQLRALISLAGLLLVIVAIPCERASAASLTQTYTISGRVTDGLSNGISGATVTLSGAESRTTTTDSNGSYSFANLQAGGDFTLSPSKP